MLSEKGFTLLEVAISLAILAGVVITVLTVLNHHLMVVDEDRGIILATLLAREKIEEIRLKGLPEKGEGIVPGLPQFTWYIDVQDLSLSPFIKDGGGFKMVEVKVSWDMGRREVALASYMAQ